MIKSSSILLHGKMLLMYLFRRAQSIVSLFYKKDAKAILFVPHSNCRKDGYDIMNWTGDNVLCLAHYMIASPSYDTYKKILVVDPEDKIESFSNYCKQVNPNANVSFVHSKSAIRESWKVKYIFTSSSVQAFNNKTSKQVLVDLNYFTPFKNDYLYEKGFRRVVYKTRQCFDFVVTTAHLASRIQALDLGLPLSSFIELGFPRNDIFYRDNQHVIRDYLQQVIASDIKTIFVYTPTYRDYEKDLSIKRDLFGYPSFDYDKLGDLLEESNSIIIVKMHVLQIENVDFYSIRKRCKRIVLFEELNRQFSLYQCLSEADCLITDYTSVYFDFLHRNKPVIFNYYDIQEYSQERGFSFYPIEAISAGYIVKQSDELLNAINMVLNGDDRYYNERQTIKKLFDSHYDGLSAKRICDYFFH